MANPSRTICLSDAATIAADTSVIVNIPEAFTSALGFVTVGTVTGTSPTLDVEIYQGVRTPVAADVNGRDCTDNAYANYTWLPYCKLKQLTASNTGTFFGVVGSGQYNANVTASNSFAFPTAGTFQNGPIGSVWKVTFNVGGTNPSFGSVVMAAQFIP